MNSLGFGILVFFAALSSTLGDPRAEVLRFMQRENFLKRCQDQLKSEDECISDLKRFCGMQHVGGSEISPELLACVRRPRCGLPMLPGGNRSKTFAEEFPKFQKSHLTYIVLNGATKTILTQAEILKMVEMALEVWMCYTPLQFSRVASLKEADLILSFTPMRHGYHNYFTKEYVPQGYDFDGPGGVLAHAFLPYRGASNMGNFHWDDDETWIENHRTGIKIFHTTVHEIGHNLGLSHIPTTGNIMYPAYDDSYHETELDLGSLDIYQIQVRYGSRQCSTKVWQEYYKKKYPNGDTTCEDRTSCGGYDYKQCLSDREWMSKNCAKHCGFCGECKDTSSHCSNYEKSRCSRDTWFVRNCKAFCGFCASKADPKFGASYSLPRYNVKEEICSATRIDGAFKSSSGFLYLLVRGVLFRHSSISKEIDPHFRRRIADLWDQRLSQPTATAYMPSSDTLLLFQRNDLFLVSGLSSAQPKVTAVPLPALLTSPQAAFMGRYAGEPVVNVVHDHKISSISVDGETVTILKTRPFADIFEAGSYKERIPYSVDSAFQDGEAVLFLTGSSATVAYPSGDRYTLPSSGMKPFMTEDLGCPQVF